MSRCLNAAPQTLFAVGAADAPRCRRFMRLRPRTFLLALLAITALGAGLRWSFMDHPMRYDEALNYYQFTSRSPQYILTHYNPGNHVLHTLMVRVSTELFGRTPLGLRLPVFVGGTLLIPLTALLAWMVTRDRWLALIAALAAAASAQLVEYSTNARGYVWLAVMATGALICALWAMSRPEAVRRWVAWGVVSALGAYTMPLMIYPMAGMLLGLGVMGLRRGRVKARGRATLRGAVIGAVMCGAVTLALYASILWAMGPGEVWGLRTMTVKVWAPRVGGFGNMLLLAVRAWTRAGGWWWPGLLGAGLLAYVIQAVRRPSPARLLLLLTLFGAALAVRVHDAPLQDRAWMFGLPTFLVCAVAGIGRFRRCGKNPAQRHWAACGVVCVLAVGELALARSVAGQTYLCSEPNVQVNICEIIDTWRDGGPERCALVMRYTPAANYYRDLWGLPAPLTADAPQAELVIIVADAVNALADQWNPETTGFHRFAAPRVLRELSDCTIYVAERVD